MKYRYSLILLLLLPLVVAPGARAFTSIDYGPNWADDSVLVRSSTNVFVGKVLAQVGTLPPDPNVVSSHTSYQYSVRVILNIKGNLNFRGTVSGSVTIDQFDFGGHLVEPGSTYLFSSNYDSRDGWYIATIYPYTYQLITNDSRLNDFELRLLAESNDKVIAVQNVCTDSSCLLPSIESKFMSHVWLVVGAIVLLIFSLVWWRRRKRIVGQPEV